MRGPESEWTAPNECDSRQSQTRDQVTGYGLLSSLQTIASLHATQRRCISDLAVRRAFRTLALRSNGRLEWLISPIPLQSALKSWLIAAKIGATKGEQGSSLQSEGKCPDVL
jgi:hypothetical protein